MPASHPVGSAPLPWEPGSPAVSAADRRRGTPEHAVSMSRRRRSGMICSNRSGCRRPGWASRPSSAVVIGGASGSKWMRRQRTAILTWVACGGDLVLVDAGLDMLPDPRTSPEARRVVLLRHSLSAGTGARLSRRTVTTARASPTTLMSDRQRQGCRHGRCRRTERPSTNGDHAGSALPYPASALIHARAYIRCYSCLRC